ncbi:putative anthocyanidin reductase [Cajanus cajan]|uniref:Dihydroflavonol-4-reductase n=1 Tax=Cajanus cajan TaxID=3821 RepID=A0A151RX35_CAJCA|nr:putative anthocyanidin reductase [Cajanus cajan]KYP47122.1 Dihydroflavonol-4-reductase [Cajanus cajan]
MEEALETMMNKVQISSSPATYCVTGGKGYLGSWLVETLLERGYIVHATVRDPEKSLHFLPLWKGNDRLRIFKADLNEEGSFDEAVKGCDGVFHVAASKEYKVDETENIEAYVQANIIDPAIKGTINVLKSCLNSNSVKRVVYTSSMSTMSAKDSNGKWKPVVDESCQIQTEHMVKTQPIGWVYALSKHLTEEAAFKFAKENGIDLVSVITTAVAGQFFTANNVPPSVKVLLSPLTGEPEFFKLLSSVNARMGSISAVHIEDICSAHIFLMEHSKAEGRYICSSQCFPISMLANLLAKEYSYSNKKKIAEKNCDKVPSDISSKKLKDLGFCYKYGLEDIIHQTIICCQDYGYLPPIIQ